MSSNIKYVGMDVHKQLVVCDPRRNALLQDGNHTDRVDARKLSDLLYMHKLKPVYHGDHGLRTLKELVRSYLTITRDLSRVMTRVKAIEPLNRRAARRRPTHLSLEVATPVK